MSIAALMSTDPAAAKSTIAWTARTSAKEPDQDLAEADAVFAVDASLALYERERRSGRETPFYDVPTIRVILVR